jgi:hypothetical protein
MQRAAFKCPTIHLPPEGDISHSADFYRHVLDQAHAANRTVSINTLGRAIYEGRIVALNQFGAHLEWTNGGVEGYREYAQVFIAIEHIVGININGRA